MNDFPWTDKSASKWYIIYPHGHEGPYSLEYLEKKLQDQLINNQIKIWCEGLKAELTLEAVLASLASAPNKNTSSALAADDGPPPLPPLPLEEEEKEEEKVSVLREELKVESSATPSQEKQRKTAVVFFVFLLIFSLLSGTFYLGQKNKKEMSILRPQGMSLKLVDKINDYLTFRGWNEALFFKEFVSDGYQSIWLASASFHTCDVFAHFKSQKDKLLSMSDEDIEFEAKGILKNHLVRFEKIDFVEGRRMTPGMYDMEIKASNCQWDGLIAKAMNLFKTPAEAYSSKMSVILYVNGADEFKELLDKVTRKKLEKAIQEQNQVELFWQGIQEKLQTLLAITLQIEQFFIDFMKKDSRSFHIEFPMMVNDYTKKYGDFLTNFVVSNEESFKEYNLSGIKGVSTRRNYELVISEAAQKIGYTSMKLIEDLQKLKNPRRTQLNGFEQRVLQDFSELKTTINQKIIEVSDDRSLYPGEEQLEDSPSPE